MSDPRDDELIAALEAIDAALHDEPVDPELADLAELSLILRDERSRADPGFLATLDRRAADRFTTPAPGRSGAPARPPTRGRATAHARRPGRARGLWWGAGPGLAGAAAIVLVIVFGLHGGGASSPDIHNGAPRYASGAASGTAAGTATVTASSSASGAGTAAGAGSASSSARGPGAKVPSAAPVPRAARGRDLTQSARIALRARRGGVSAVAEQVYDLVGAEHGYVQGSHVLSLAGGAGRASFTLSVPASRLQATLTRLSSLRGATVVSRADASADITGDVDATAQRLAAARSLRRSLLARLAAATTTSGADQLQDQLRADAAAIAADAGALARLHHRVADSTIAVSVTAPPAAGRRPHRSGGAFTIARALHDAGRVLVVAAGVALIALAVLVPLALLLALVAWVWAHTLQRRREGALGS